MKTLGPFLFVLYFITSLSCTKAPLFMTICSKTNFTTDSDYSLSLNDLVSGLVHSSSSLLYANYSNGEAYGMFQCRGDLADHQCFDCVNTAMDVAVHQKCPSSTGANILYDDCHIQYDDNPTFFNGSSTDAYPETFSVCTTDQNADAMYQSDAQRALENITISAALMENYYATTCQGLVYAQAQCDSYLSPSQCSACLSQLFIFKKQCNQSTGGRSYYGRCSGRYENYIFFPILTDPSPPSPSKTLIIGGTIGGILFGGLCVCAFLIYVLRRRDRLTLEAFIAEDDFRSCLPPASKFSYEELKRATGDFGLDNKLGQGGFGPVYKGTLSDGREVAIKKLAVDSRQGKREFMNEVKIITSVQHRNLIKLYGCCVKGSERLLVYEYLPNKSLNFFLFDCEGNNSNSTSVVLDWHTRFEIIHGIARGLAYLHEESQVCIIHRDIKPSNILLDNELMPKIADFGLARLFSKETSRIITTVAGTLGYLSPEYAIHGHLTEKNDVFSFGVVTLEIVSGRRNADFRLPERKQRLLDWAWSCYRASQELQLLDEKLTSRLDLGEEQELVKVIHIALLCTQSSALDRPSMSKVLQLLTGQLETFETHRADHFAGNATPHASGTV